MTKTRTPYILLLFYSNSGEFPLLEASFKTNVSFQLQSIQRLFPFGKFTCTSQGCALAEPSGPWHLTFALGRLENLVFFHTNYMLGTLDFTVSEHWAPFNFPWSTVLLHKSFVAKIALHLVKNEHFLLLIPRSLLSALACAKLPTVLKAMGKGIF